MQQKIVFYDGECGFCNRTVQLVLNHEKNSELFFSALQSDFAGKFFQDNYALTPDLSTFYFFNGSQLYERSTAALKLLPHLKWYWQWGRMGWVLPKPWRDALYNFVAHRRRQIAGSYCVVPTEDQRKRFLNEAH